MTSSTFGGFDYMSAGYDKDSPMWINDPQVCRDMDPDWDARIERAGFDYHMRKGIPPAEAYRQLDARKRYAAFLAEHRSSLATKDANIE